MEQKINTILQTVQISSSKQIKPINDKQNTADDEKQSTLLNKILNTIESNSVQTNSDQTKKIINNTCDDLSLNKEIKSVGSAHSTDETLTATERGDEEEDDLNDNDSNNGNNNNNNNNGNTESNDSNENDTNSKYDQSKSNQKSNKHTNNSSSTNNSTNNKSLMDKLLLKDTSESLKNFKIPKQTRKDCQSQPDHTDKPISPGIFSSSSSNGSNRSTPSAFENIPARNDLKYQTKHNRNLSSDSFTFTNNHHNNSNYHEYSSSESSSPLLNPSSGTNDSNPSNKYSSYYHPKKNQFRQYLMESSSSTKHNLSNSSSDGYFNTHYSNREDISANDLSANGHYHHSKSMNGLNHSNRINNNNNNRNHYDYETYRNGNSIISSNTSSNTSGWPYGGSQSDYGLGSQGYNTHGNHLISSNETTSFGYTNKK